MRIRHHCRRFSDIAAVVPTLSLLVAAFVTGAAAADPSTVLPRSADIASAAASVGDHYRAAVPCSSSNCAIDNTWDDAVLMMGVVEHWRSHGTAPYKTYAENWAKANSWRLRTESTGKDQQDRSWSNRMAAGYTYLRLLQAGSPGATVAHVTASLEAQLALKLSPEREQLVDYVFPGQTRGSRSWKEVDAEFVALPPWIMMGKHSGKKAYYDRARDLQNYQVDVMRIRDPVTKLWYRDETYKTARSPNGEKIIWGRGTGWIAGALALAIAELPASRPEYATYRTRFVELMNAARARQRPDGFWNMNLTDPEHFPAPETSATALITYAMAKGIDLGILGNSYRPAAAKAWNAMAATAVADDGHLGFCQQVGKEPVPPGDPRYPGEAATGETNFCVGAFLLAGSAMRGIATTSGPTRVKTYEAEALATSVSPGETQADVSNRYADGERANAAILRAKNDFVQYTAQNVPDGTYNLRVKFRRAGNHGIWQLKTNGVNTGAPVDGFDRSAHYAEVDLGSVTYSGGLAKYRFVVIGKNQLSSGYRVGVDNLSLSLFDIAAGSRKDAVLLSQVFGSRPAAVAPGGGPVAVASVPLPPAAGLLLGSLCLLGLAARNRRNRRA